MQSVDLERYDGLIDFMVDALLRQVTAPQNEKAPDAVLHTRAEGQRSSDAKSTPT